MSTIQVVNAKHPSSASNNLVLDSSGNAAFANNVTVTGNMTSTGMVVPSSSFLRNRIINGDMRIDQRNAGASVTPTAGTAVYTVDRWNGFQSQASKFSVQQNAGSVTPPSGFTNYLGVTSLSAYTVAGNETYLITQVIEGYNVSDLNWGTANALPATLSFWVRSSLTGTFGGSIATTKTAVWVMPFTYTVSSANTWTYVTVSIPAATSTGGTNSDNAAGVFVRFGLGSAGTASGGTAGAWTNAGNFTQPSGTVSVVGTNGATFYVTGVQLEVGTAATPFERRQYGQELALCQRYFQRIGSTFFGATEGSTTFNLQVPFWVPMRASSTVSGVSGGIFSCRYSGDTNITNPTLANISSTAENVWLQVVSSGLISGVPIYGRSQNYPTSNFLNAVAEL